MLKVENMKVEYSGKEILSDINFATAFGTPIDDIVRSMAYI